VASFTITEEMRGDVAIVTLSGDVTPGKIEGVLSTRMLHLANNGYKKVVLNLHGLPSIDSIGLGEIVRSYTSLMRQGAKLKLAAVPKKIVDLLRVTRLIMAFELEATNDDAVAKFR
jgi:anti-sigma B factor antagonist